MASDISPFIARQLIEEGAGIQATIGGVKYLFQRNPGLNYFNYRKWRVTEDYTISSEGRNKIYCVAGQSPRVYTSDEFDEAMNKAERIDAVPPSGSHYKPRQLKFINQDLHRLAQIIKKFQR